MPDCALGSKGRRGEAQWRPNFRAFFGGGERRRDSLDFLFFFQLLLPPSSTQKISPSTLIFSLLSPPPRLGHKLTFGDAGRKVPGPVANGISARAEEYWGVGQIARR